MDINSKNKRLCLEPLRGIVTQGEKLADTVTFRLPNVYGNLTLSALSWQLRAASEKNTLATADLTASASGEFCLVQWEVSADFTAVSGALSLMLVGTDSEGNVVIKFPGDDPIWIRDAETGQYSPPEDAIQKALNGLQQAESALEDATKALQEIGINFKVLGHYGTLPELEAAVTSPSLGDAYGVGDPTVVYVWNGTSWAPLPGVFQPYPHTNLLVNPRFKYNSRGQSTYTGAVWTVDGWRSSANLSVTVADSGVTITSSDPSSGVSFYQYANRPVEELNGKAVTFSVCDSSGNIYSITVSLPSAAPSSTTTIRSVSAPFGMISVSYYKNDNGINNYGAQVVVYEGTPASLTAAKLELGSVSTLQAELDNPPPEDVEKLKLDMYSLDPGRCAYLPWHNENLLDNWYFVGGGSQQGGGQFPINQRGETSYTAGGYCVDRWGLESVEASLNSDYVLLDFNQTSHSFFQKIERNLSGTHLTFSVLHSSNIRLTITIMEGSAFNHLANKTFNVTSDISLSIVDADIPEISATQRLWVRIFSPEANYQIKVYAAKLELGYLSTLARKDEEGNWVLNDPPPNFQQELAKCQRYLFDPFMGFNGYADLADSGLVFTQTECAFSVFFPSNMRIFPSLVGRNFSMFKIASVIGGVHNSQIPVTNITILNWAANRVLLRVVTSENLTIGATCGLWVQQDSGSPPPILFSAEL